MAVIIVSKTGQSFMTRDGDKNPRGEIVGTQDLIRHLSEVGHRVIYFGAHRGEIPYAEVALRPDVSDMSTYMSWREQKARFDKDSDLVLSQLTRLGWDGSRPPLWIESCGLSASYSFVGNSRGVSPLMSSLRYTAPILGVMDRLKSPRVCTISDIRAYPRDGEMSDQWPGLMPAALLDQRSDVTEWESRIAFKRYKIRAVPSHGWSWGYLDWLEPQKEPMFDFYGCSHCHVGTGFRKKARDSAWSQMLGDNGEVLTNEWNGGHRMVMYGEGFEHWSGYEASGGEDVFRGPKPFPFIMQGLATSHSSPVVAPDECYLTSKPVLIASRGCLPIFLTDHEHAWDPSCSVIPMVSQLRSRMPMSTLNVAQASYQFRVDELNQLRFTLRQRFDIIDNLVEDYEAGLYWSDWDEWHEKYGGYRTA